MADPSTIRSSANGPPPRSGEDRERSRHRTVGAAEENIRFARQLRRKMSLPEVLLWQELRKRPHGFRFRRQFPIQGYVLDFACLERRLAIEVDGEALSRGDRPERDERRDSEVKASGYAMLRIGARDVLENLDAVVVLIVSRSRDRPLHRLPLSSGPRPRSGQDRS